MKIGAGTAPIFPQSWCEPACRGSAMKIAADTAPIFPDSWCAPADRESPPIAARALAHGNNTVIPTGAERSEAEWRDLSGCCTGKTGPSTAPPFGRLRSG